MYEDIREKIEELRTLRRELSNKSAELEKICKETPELADIGKVLQSAEATALNTEWVEVEVTDYENPGEHLCDIRVCYDSGNSGTCNQIVLPATVTQEQINLMDDLLVLLYDVVCEQHQEIPKWEPEDRFGGKNE